MKTPTPDSLKLPAGHRAMRWVAKDQAEVDKWTKDFAKRDCVVHKLNPHPAPSTQVDVIFSFNPANSLLTLGYFPQESDWLVE